jgi:hypothetical protein
MSTIPSGTFDFRFGQQQDENGAEDEVEDQVSILLVLLFPPINYHPRWIG